ncbi:MAG: tRNA 2-thiouridine(34) synthase MnmA [Candidatus Sungbacteria bacterium]|uniref:tRNA-specific 2-thiouridylase MnmA n=1 Tax=Candidatus Sungiibacteriota bacterium TaxID=2750080 RepID=A0A931YDA9_9BACT|nr:tRNA 2-thiouridine(34) synthase MnmA [Candidatus Sungbacteria bacterium]
MARIWNKHKQFHPVRYSEQSNGAGTPLKRKVFVAMSGGVDSSVAALLLKNQGYDVTGVFMKNWADPAWPCPWQEDREDAIRVCLKLDAPFEVFDFTNEYKTKVVDYMLHEYASGRTPNPDVMCNKEIKFGLFLDKAMAMGADYIATGHYVRKIKSQKSNLKNYVLAKARDLNKDQSYFLWTLKQKQLAKCLFPIGEIESKAEVRRIALASGLPTAQKKDSQGICFMGPVDVGEFIKPYVNNVSGDIVTASGQKIGRHAGLDFFTIGQRKGIGVGGTGPYYVAKKDYKTNVLVVASKGEEFALESKSAIVCQTSFIGDEPREKAEIQAAIRYRQEPVPTVLSKVNNDKWRVDFEKSVRAVAPGQSAVFYRGEELLGGGIID